MAASKTSQTFSVSKEFFKNLQKCSNSTSLKKKEEESRTMLLRTSHSSTTTHIGPSGQAKWESHKKCKSYICKLQHMPLLLILQIHCEANISRSLAELSAILRHMKIYHHNQQRSAGLDLNNPSQADRLRKYRTENPYMESGVSQRPSEHSGNQYDLI